MSTGDLMQRLAAAGCLISHPTGSTVTGGQAPTWVVEPAGVGQLAAAVRLLAERDVTWRVDSLGRNWGYDDSRVTSPHLVVRLARLRQLSVDEELGTVTVQPGVTFLDVNTALGEQSHWRLPYPGSGPYTSVLGNALERGQIRGLGERERCCRDFLVMDRADGAVARWGWPDGIDSRARAALPYPPGPHRQGELFQAKGYGPLVVELTHTLAVKARFGMELVLLDGPDLTLGLLACWQEGLRDDLMSASVLQPAHRRRLQGYATSHDGLTLKFDTLAGSGPTLQAKITELRALARGHELRLAANQTPVLDDLALIGATTGAPEAVGEQRLGMEWHTVAMPFASQLVVDFWQAMTADDLLAGAAWTLRSLDVRSLIWMLPFVYDKHDPDSIDTMRARVSALHSLRERFALPEYRSAAVRSP